MFVENDLSIKKNIRQRLPYKLACCTNLEYPFGSKRATMTIRLFKKWFEMPCKPHFNDAILLAQQGYLIMI